MVTGYSTEKLTSVIKSHLIGVDVVPPASVATRRAS